MAGEAKTYNSDEVTVTIGGILVTGGYADGEFLRIEIEADGYDDVVGTDGEVTRSKTNDGRANAILRLMSSSDVNDQLSELHERDKRTPGGVGVGALYVRDRSGRAIYKARQCWIKRAPNVSFDRTATVREWTIRIANLQRFDGGN